MGVVERETDWKGVLTGIRFPSAFCAAAEFALMVCIGSGEPCEDFKQENGVDRLLQTER